MGCAYIFHVRLDTPKIAIALLHSPSHCNLHIRYEYLFATRDRLKRYQAKNACLGDDFEQFAETARALAKERFHDAVLVDQVRA